MNGNASAAAPSRGDGHQIATARRPERGESRWAAAIAVLAASGLQMTLPSWLSFGPHWLLPALEIALLGALIASSPGRLERRSAALRAGGLALAGLLSLTNAALAVLLVNDLARGGGTRSAAALLLAGGALWAANVLIFALWYWELDRGGPADRCHTVRMYPEGPADRVGCVRVFPLVGGHRETLTGLDDQQRTIAFAFGDNAGLPVRSYRSMMPVQPVNLGDHTYVEWSSRFDCDEADEDKVTAAVRDGVLVPGLKALEQQFGLAR